MSEGKKMVGASFYKFKTELCKNFEDFGFCDRVNCTFAHGLKELRQITIHDKYKTGACRHYWKEAVCPWGKLCSFIHDKTCPSCEFKHGYIPKLEVFKQYHIKK
jgi:hypothetical protein